MGLDNYVAEYKKNLDVFFHAWSKYESLYLISVC